MPLNLALTAFFADNQIKHRYQEAMLQGFGSIAWQKTPTLQDFLPFCSPEHLLLESVNIPIRINKQYQDHYGLVMPNWYWLNSTEQLTICRYSWFYRVCHFS